MCALGARHISLCVVCIYFYQSNRTQKFAIGWHNKCAAPHTPKSVRRGALNSSSITIVYVIDSCMVFRREYIWATRSIDVASRGANHSFSQTRFGKREKSSLIRYSWLIQSMHRFVAMCERANERTNDVHYVVRISKIYFSFVNYTDASWLNQWIYFFAHARNKYFANLFERFRSYFFSLWLKCIYQKRELISAAMTYTQPKFKIELKKKKNERMGTIFFKSYNRHFTPTQIRFSSKYNCNLLCVLLELNVEHTVCVWMAFFVNNTMGLFSLDNNNNATATNNKVT